MFRDLENPLCLGEVSNRKSGQLCRRFQRFFAEAFLNDKNLNCFLLSGIKGKLQADSLGFCFSCFYLPGKV